MYLVWLDFSFSSTEALILDFTTKLAKVGPFLSSFFSDMTGERQRGGGREDVVGEEEREEEA